MSQFIDRRLNSKNKSMLNRQRFIRRFKQQIKKAVSEAINGRSITNIEQGEKINIPAKDLSEPSFTQGAGGVYERVLPGNKEFVTGDKINRPPQQPSGGGSGSDSGSSDSGIGQDNFVFEISREEFLEIFFEDLELPNLIKKEINEILSQKTVRAGYTSSGIPANINIVKSMRGAVGRRLALTNAKKNKITELQELIDSLNKSDKSDKSDKNNNKIDLLKLEIEKIKNSIGKTPFIDTIDIRYNNKITQPTPNTNAVMFCVMDVSGSMDETKKDIAKRFFILLYLFLTRTYEKIEIIFIRHHTCAKEVSEEDFFYSRETGGTVVSSALELMSNIINTRYKNNSWNIYAAQASDGDNWNNDSPRCRDIIINDIMPHLQYFSYIEIMPRHHQSLWEVYTEIQSQFKNFSMQHIKTQSDIYQVFRSIFQKREQQL